MKGKPTMSHKNTPTVPMNATVSMSTPKDIDYPALVERVASRKASQGKQVFDGRRKEQNLFALVCAMLKSMLGMAPSDRLTDDVAAKVKEAVSAFWETKAQSFLNYGEVTSAIFHIPTVKVDKSKGAVSDVHFAARMTARKEVANGKERSFVLTCAKENSEKQLAKLLESPVYDRDVKANLEIRIRAIDKEIAKLKAVSKLPKSKKSVAKVAPTSPSVPVVTA